MNNFNVLTCFSKTKTSPRKILLYERDHDFVKKGSQENLGVIQYIYNSFLKMPVSETHQQLKHLDKIWIHMFCCMNGALWVLRWHVCALCSPVWGETPVHQHLLVFPHDRTKPLFYVNTHTNTNIYSSNINQQNIHNAEHDMNIYIITN